MSNSNPVVSADVLERARARRRDHTTPLCPVCVQRRQEPQLGECRPCHTARVADAYQRGTGGESKAAWLRMAAAL